MAFPDVFNTHFGKYVEDFIMWLTINYDFFFDGIKAGILKFMIFINKGLMLIPWFVVIALIFWAAWKLIDLKSGIIFSIMLFLIGSFDYWEPMMTTLAIVLTSVIISLLIGIPVGIFISYKKRAEKIAMPILDAMQTMPSFVYLLPAIMFFGLGLVPAVFATTIYALPPVIRLTNLAIHSVSKEMVEASNSFGASKWQTLMKVEIPQAMPTIMAGINQTTMMAMAMVVISSMIGARGLGLSVLTSINRIDIAMGVEAGTCVVFMAIIIDRLTQAFADRYKYE
ncbi:MAG: proline/glycine betaine ABC transporter permease [Peptostreptococcaceae bacterium]|nr:proline/glycine betaine ABC transporter permease [Peptostreptococcaceae bacterium]